jgi:hypothetical protein
MLAESVTSGFRHELDENSALLGCYAASGGNFLPTFRDNLSVPSSGFKNPKVYLVPEYHFSIHLNQFIHPEHASSTFFRNVGIFNECAVQKSVV